MRKFNTRIIPKEYWDNDDLYEIYGNGEIKYLLKENIIDDGDSDGDGDGLNELYEKHGILNYRDLANRYNKIK